MAPKAEIAILVKMRDEASRTMGKMAGNIEKHAGTIRKAGMAITAVGVAMAASMVLAAKSALAQGRGIARLDVLLKKQGSSYEEVRENLEAYIMSVQRATGFGDELQRDIVGKLIPVFGDYELALRAMPLILDAMKLSGMAADSVIRGLGRALAGQVNTAISVGLAFDKTMTVMDRFALVEKEIGGLAEEMYDPFTALTGALGDLSQAMIDPLLPTLTSVLKKLTDITLELTEMNPALQKFISYAWGAGAAVASIVGPLLLIISQLAILKIAGVAWAAALIAVAAPVLAILAVIGATIAAVALQWDEFVRGLRVIRHFLTLGLAPMPPGLALEKARNILKGTRTEEMQGVQFGGVVPGRIGQPQLAVVHGGETITPADGVQSMVITIQGGPIFMTDERDMMRLGAAISDAQKRRSRGTVGVNP